MLNIFEAVVHAQREVASSVSDIGVEMQKPDSYDIYMFSIKQFSFTFSVTGSPP